MRTSERRLILETPSMHGSGPMQAYISREVAKPCKQWVHEVLGSKRETDRIKLRTPDFVLLPDVDAFYKRPKPSPFLWQEVTRWRARRPAFHWLAVVNDTSLRTIRDLRGEHIPMLVRLYHTCCQKIREETGVSSDQVMAYIHYPPSVYQLHIHFKYPLGPPSHDAFRVHLLSTVINNLAIDGDYYKKSLLQLPVYLNTDLHSALAARPASPIKIQIVSRDRCILLLTQCTSTSRGSRPSTPDPPSGTSSSSATPATPP